MTEGEKKVILIRAQTLSDDLGFYAKLLRQALRVGVPDWPRYVFDYMRRVGVDPAWNAQRLLSSVERARGTRRRLYDVNALQSKEEG